MSPCQRVGLRAPGLLGTPGRLLAASCPLGPPALVFAPLPRLVRRLEGGEDLVSDALAGDGGGGDLVSLLGPLLGDGWLAQRLVRVLPVSRGLLRMRSCAGRAVGGSAGQGRGVAGDWLAGRGAEGGDAGHWSGLVTTDNVLTMGTRGPRHLG